MTREDRWIVSLDEIRALRRECASCGVAISYALNQTIRLPVGCPSCGADTFEPNSPDYRAMDAFVRALKALLQAPRSAPGGTLRLEFLAEPARHHKADGLT
jgi:hypothetical protein